MTDFTPPPFNGPKPNFGSPSAPVPSAPMPASRPTPAPSFAPQPEPIQPIEPQATLDPQPIVNPIASDIPEEPAIRPIQETNPSYQQPSNSFKEKFEKIKEFVKECLDTKNRKILAGIIFILGIFFGNVFFGGGEGNQVIQGLAGVVQNSEPEISTKSRCGIAERTQGCILYLMNASRTDKEAKDFYNQAADITGVPPYDIQMSNIRYATTVIRPGHIAQLNIPAK